MIWLAIAVSLATVAVGIGAALVLRVLPTVRVQLVALALLATGLPLGAILFSGLVMLSHDHAPIVLVGLGSSAAGLAAALLLGSSIMRRVDRLGEASSALASGDLAARAPVDGPRELAELAASFNEMATSIEGLFDARRQLVAWASHDLRTPLASMQAMLEALEDGLAEPERYLPALREQVRTLSGLVDDLFELSRIDAGALTLELREARLNGLVESCLRGVEAEAEARRVRVGSRIADGTPAVRCAPDKVERVLYNLLANALRHTPSDGSVAVVVEPIARAGEVVVSVEDTGEGIPADALRRVFDRFWRADASRSRARGGSGLGLAIAQGLVEAQGGRIWAENRPGGGARISFTLPAA
ncbi:MAG: HAMP domain-containing sensor histidine kinase [Thermoleophilia bacterium]